MNKFLFYNRMTIVRIPSTVLPLLVYLPNFIIFGKKSGIIRQYEEKTTFAIFNDSGNCNCWL